MFESTSSRSATGVNRALVALTLTDGTTANVSARLPLSGKIADALNNADQFLDIVTLEGDQLFIAKAAISKVHLVDVPKASQLNMYRRASDKAVFNPYAVLKVSKQSSPEEIRAAYLAMARMYHVDRLASYELPAEMREYAHIMQVRINLAYEQIAG